MNFKLSTSNFKLTLTAWPVVAVATIGLCFLTQQVASWFGITLPDQQNIAIVKQWAGWNKTFVLLCLQILILLPMLEEFVFRFLLFRIPSRKLPRPRHPIVRLFDYSIVSSVLFSAAHYIFQPFPDAAFLALAFFGLAQCWLYRRTDRLWCPMLNHALFNLTNLVLLFIIPEQGGTL